MNNDLNIATIIHYARDNSTRISELYKTLGSPVRLHILSYLYREPAYFGEILDFCGLQPSSLSNHLNLFISQDIVEKLDRGLYNLNRKGVDFFETVVNLSRRLEGRCSVHVFSEEPTMSEIKITELEPMYVASVRKVGFVDGIEPEKRAWAVLKLWAEEREIYNKDHPIFGFNHPDGDTHGYELWIQVDEDTKPDESVDIKFFKGGRFTVKRTQDLKNIGKDWKTLVKETNNSKYSIIKGQCFEKTINYHPKSNEEVTHDLLLPVE